MKERLSCYKQKYKLNPSWYWLLASVFFFPILPEYVSPFILFAGFIIFRIEWSRKGRNIKNGTVGKMMMLFMALSIISTIWSPTMFSTFATAALWWGMYLIEAMIYNLADTKKRISTLMKVYIASGTVNGAIAALQIISFTLFRYQIISYDALFVTPFYKKLDFAVYTFLPFQISTGTFDDRASGFYSNPNLLCTYLLTCLPLAIYFFLNAKSKKEKIKYFAEVVIISAGISSTMTRAGCLIAIAGWIVLFIMLFKRHWKNMLKIFVPIVALITPSLLTRYGVIVLKPPVIDEVIADELVIAGAEEAEKSSAMHLQIWKSLIHFITHDVKAFIIGVGFGLEQTGKILLENYNLKKPHAHNFIIETWVELGIIGVILLFAVFICAGGKLLEINTNSKRRLSLVFCAFMSFAIYLVFGLSDYIFNSPKQIIILFILLGIIQAISRVYEKQEIHDTKSLIKVARKEIENATK